MTRRLWISVALFVLVLIGKLIFDVRLYQAGGANDHLLGPAIVAAAVAACTWLAGWRSVPMWLFGWWAIFDVGYALAIGQHWNYVGTTARLDILQRAHPWILWIKFIGAAASITQYVIYAYRRASNSQVRPTG